MIVHQDQSDPPLRRGQRVLVTGGHGFVGRNLLPLVESTGAEILAPPRRDCDLLEQSQVRRLLADTRPHVVFHLAGLVGGVLANKERPAEFFYNNSLMGALVLHESWRAGVDKYITLIGACSYPASAPSPIAETELWNGYPFAESAPYSLGKSMSVLQARSYREQYGFNAIVLVPGNLYGPFDNFHLSSSHVIPALIRRFHEAKAHSAPEVVVWGSGRPVRDFVYVKDACAAILRAAQVYGGGDIINISSGVLTSIRDLVEKIAELLAFRGTIRWDESKPDGQMAKGLDVTRMQQWLGYSCQTPLVDGLAKTITWFLHEESKSLR